VTQSYQFFATCPKGVEDLLAKECEQLAFQNIDQAIGGVSFDGTLKDGYQLCLWSRLASRVLLQLSTFEPDDYDDLYASVQQVDWSEHMSAEGSFAIDCFTSHEVINNSHYATLRVKDAVADQFIEKQSTRPDVARERPDIRINVYIGKKTSILYLDLSGEPLHIRGYRQQTGEAPLKENLASAILLRCKWPEIAKQGVPLCDPMCGSGTLLIEAAAMAANIAPGFLRSYYGFLGWKQHNADEWDELYNSARKLIDKNAIPPIVGADNSKSVVDIAKNNIKAAGFDEYIKLYQRDVSDAIPDLPEGNGLLVTNPPYGKRLGQVEQLKGVYYRLGQSLKNHYQGWQVAVFTSDDVLAKSIGLRSHHKNTLYNGALKCTLFQYRIRVYEKKPTQETAQRHESASMFENRLRKNSKHMARWARKNDISCYRVYDADIPQYSFAIDLYEGWAHVQEYEPPKTVDSTKAIYRLNDATSIIAEITGVDTNNVVVKTRKKQSGSEQYVRQDEKNRFVTVNEYGLKFKVNLYDYLDTGLFLDHRKVRQLIHKFSKGKSFLNLFAYTGTATVYAAAGGARSTTTVDMSNTYLEWAQENLRLNKIKGRNHQFIRADCMQWVWDAKREGHSYQVIFLDPPTFSNSKKMAQTLDISRDHVELINLVMKLLDDEGILIFSCNAKRFKLDEDKLANYSIQDITKLTTSEDFKRKPLHKCWCLSKKELVEKIGL
jgi:23S rRNA (guanine2445-N2)-methyltransferase / 23S rRNA (guanine2069-N7)-methyltransferase